MDTVCSIQEKLEGVLEREILSEQNSSFLSVAFIDYPSEFSPLLCKVTRNADIRPECPNLSQLS